MHFDNTPINVLLKSLLYLVVEYTQTYHIICITSVWNIRIYIMSV